MVLGCNRCRKDKSEVQIEGDLLELSLGGAFTGGLLAETPIEFENRKDWDPVARYVTHRVST